MPDDDLRTQALSIGQSPEHWFERDCVIANKIVDDWLRLHPADDDELVTEEWLRSVGFRDGDCGMLTRGVIHADLHAFKTFSHVTKMAVYVGRGMSTHTAIEHATRGDVRRLAAALKAPLKQGTRHDA